MTSSALTGVVQLVDVPVGLFLRAEAHATDLLRESVYVVASHDLPPDSVYHRLLRAAEEAQMRSASARTDVGHAVAEAEARGETHITLTSPAHPAVAEMTARWIALIDEMDEECRAGRLLSLPADADVLRFRRWYLDQITSQIRDHAEPTAWAQSSAGS